MGGKGSGRLNVTDRLLKDAREPLSTPAANTDTVAGEYILPNLSGIASHPEAKSNFLKIDGSNANTTIDIGSQDLTTTGTIKAEHLYSTDDAQIDDQTKIGKTGFGQANWVLKNKDISGTPYPIIVPNAINDIFHFGFMEGGIYLSQFQGTLCQLFFADGTNPLSKYFGLLYNDSSNFLHLSSANQTGSPQFRITTMDVTIRTDNKKLIFGAGEDASILYDGTDLIIDSDAVGSGSCKINALEIRNDGTIKPISLADASASNNSIYYSTTQSKLVYKDSGGTVNNLY